MPFLTYFRNGIFYYLTANYDRSVFICGYVEFSFEPYINRGLVASPE